MKINHLITSLRLVQVKTNQIINKQTFTKKEKEEDQRKALNNYK
jgi:hypothetical protein